MSLAAKKSKSRQLDFQKQKFNQYSEKGKCIHLCVQGGVAEWQTLRT
jgi:hypothetical protein